MHQTAVARRGIRSSSTRIGLARSTTWIAIGAVALLIAVIGSVVRARALNAEAASAGTASLDGLTATVHGAGWVNMDGHSMGDQGGYQMPAQMMPGAPEGDDMRLGVPLTLLNTGDEVRAFNLLEEFSLAGGRNDAPSRLHSDTFGELARLTPGSAVDGVLYFDTIAPGPGDAPLYLVWKRDGESIRLAIRLGADTPDHEHAPS